MTNKSFKLEQVLSYRGEIEKICKQKFATAKQGLEQAHDELTRDEDKVNCLTQEFNNRQQELDCIDEMRMYSDFFARKREEIKNQKSRVEELDRVMNERRDDLLEATKDKKVLESLKQKKTDEFRQETKHRENGFLDEIAVQKKA